MNRALNKITALVHVFQLLQAIQNFVISPWYFAQNGYEIKIKIARAHGTFCLETFLLLLWFACSKYFQIPADLLNLPHQWMDLLWRVT